MAGRATVTSYGGSTNGSSPAGANGYPPPGPNGNGYPPPEGDHAGTANGHSPYAPVSPAPAPTSMFAAAAFAEVPDLFAEPAAESLGGLVDLPDGPPTPVGLAPPTASGALEEAAGGFSSGFNPGGLASGGFIPEGFAPAPLVPNGLLPETMVPDGLVPDGLAVPDGLTPEGLIPEGPRSLLPDSFGLDRREGSARDRAMGFDEPESPALARPFASMPHPTAAVRAPEVPIPTQRRGDPLDAPIGSLADFPANSVMSDLIAPTPFIPEPYEGFAGVAPTPLQVPERRLPPPLEPRPGGGLNGGGLNGGGYNGGGHNGGAPGGYGGAQSSSVDEAEPATLLPRRVPSVPDIPDEVLAPDAQGDGFELTRIADFLRDERIDATDQRPDGFDMMAVVAAVRGVAQVSDAALHWTPGYGHTLRIEYQDGVDEEQVTRQVARILKETMGLEAQAGPRLSTEEPTVDRTGRTRGSARVSTAARLGETVDRQPGRPLPRPDGTGAAGIARIVLDHVQVTTLGVDATVEVRLGVAGGSTGGGSSVGQGHGPAVDAYLLRLAAGAAGDAIDQLLLEPATGVSRGRIFIEHVAVVPFAGVEVAVVVLLLVRGGFAEQLAGSAVVAGDPREAVVRATLSAVNRRLESLLA
jgi:hypothetical protein